MGFRSRRKDRQSTFACYPAPLKVAWAIEHGLTGDVVGIGAAFVVELRRPIGRMRYVAAAKILGTGRIGTWGVNSLDGGGTLLALDAASREFSTWGADVPDDGPLGLERARAFAQPETTAALGAARGEAVAGRTGEMPG